MTGVGDIRAEQITHAITQADLTGAIAPLSPLSKGRQKQYEHIR